jgi:glutamine synthetase adenylyltransferase
MSKLSKLNEPIKGLDGMPVLDAEGNTSPVGELLANVLARGQSKDPARAMDLALRLFRSKGPLEVSAEDLVLMREVVGADPALTNLAKAACLKAAEEGS